MNATFVLWKREIKKAFAKKFVLLLEILLIVGVVILLKMVNKANFFKGVDYATFFAPGIVALAIAAYSLTSGWNVIEEKASGMLRELMVLPVSRRDMFMGKVVGIATVILLKVFLITLALSFLVKFHIASYFLLVVFVALLILLFTSMGVLFSYLFGHREAYRIVATFLVLYIYFFSGIFVPLQTFSMLIFSLANPLTYGADGLRYAMIKASQFNPIVDFFVLLAILFVVMWVGIAILKKEVIK
jgi:ABC-2 type transport system permease protein